VRGSAALNGVKFKLTGKRDRRLSFDKSSPALPDRESPGCQLRQIETPGRLPAGARGLGKVPGHAVSRHRHCL
jgi:hypothetical protein